MTSHDVDAFRLTVLNPRGRDPEQEFRDLPAPGGGVHPPINFHAFAACTHGAFHHNTRRAIAENTPVLLLLRGDFRASERALADLKKHGRTAVVSLKETGLHQIAQQLCDRGRLSRFMKIVAQADGCIATTPEAAEIYPQGFSSYVQVDGLSERLEGRSRPGHFRGVATVVMKLLQIVQPNFAYFGRKDAQQSRIITQMARDLNLDSEIVVCPIVREPDGLAMSSRNAYLNTEERKAATVLSRALDAARNEAAAGVRDALQLQTVLQHVLSAEKLARVDYTEIVDRETFDPVLRLSKSCFVVLAVFIGKTRLIDNLYIEPKAPGSDELVFHF